MCISMVDELDVCMEEWVKRASSADLVGGSGKGERPTWECYSHYGTPERPG
jgi:hypothetical protein